MAALLRPIRRKQSKIRCSCTMNLSIRRVREIGLQLQKWTQGSEISLHKCSKMDSPTFDNDHCRELKLAGLQNWSDFATSEDQRLLFSVQPCLEMYVYQAHFWLETGRGLAGIISHSCWACVWFPSGSICQDNVSLLDAREGRSGPGGGGGCLVFCSLGGGVGWRVPCVFAP